jgi:drug/metabolite transporter (DMT)-like permease
MSGQLLVTAAVLGSAVLHASWNAVAHRTPDRAGGFVLMSAAYAVVTVAIVPFVTAPAAAAWPYLVGAALVQTLYNLFLLHSYEIGDFSQTYPLARGTSPLVVAIIAVTIVGQPLHLNQGVGVLIITAGLACLVFGGGRLTHAASPAVRAAILTGLTIATYTVLDGVGVRHAHATVGYIAWLFLLQGPLTILALFALRGRPVIPTNRGQLLPGLSSGAVSLTAYGIVIWAQTRGSLATVSALREISILFGAIIGLLFFHENFGRWRLIGAALTVVGVVLVTV